MVVLEILLENLIVQLNKILKIKIYIYIILMSSYLDESSSEDSDVSLNTPIIDAIIEDDFELFLESIKSSDPLNEVSEDGENCLQIALKCKSDLKYIKSLIKSGLNYEPSILLSVLNEQYFKFFCKLNKDIYNYQDENSNETILMSACRQGNLNIVKQIYIKTNKKNELDNNGMNCLLHTALNNKSGNIFEITGYLITSNPEIVNSTDNNGNNFLQILEKNSYISKNDSVKTIIFKYLIDNGLKINHVNNDGNNILMTMIDYCNQNEWESCHDYFVFLIKQGIDLNIKDNNNLTILLQCLELVDIKIKLTSNNKFSKLKEEFSHIRKVINIIIEHKKLSSEEKKSIMKFKEKITKHNLI